MDELIPRLNEALAGHYRVLDVLGHGGMAVVYLAEDVRHQRRVAIKVLRPEWSAVLGAERFLREISITAQLDHPHILPLLDSGEVAPAEGPPTLYYVMPLVEGESLRDRLHREKQLPLSDALQIAREVADALSYAHGRGVVHRDIKPENILLSGGHARVADFGIARALYSAGGDRLTETGLTVGTPAYMSPEQAAGEAVDARSDIYALGCVVYEMLAASPPFTGPTAAAILARRLTEPVPSLRSSRETIPPAIDQAVARALARLPADRPATASDFAAALRTDEETAVPSRPSPAAPSRRRGPVLVAAGLALVAVLAVAGVLLRGGRSAILPEASVIAVMPFGTVSPDTQLARLGFELAGTISANLEGLPAIRAVDRLTVAAQTQAGGRPRTLEESAALGRRLGAGSVVYGTLAPAGPDIRLDLRLHSTATAAPLAEPIMLTASADSLVPVTDSVTRILLAQVWHRGGAPTPGLTAALRTQSLPALRAFLRGERAVGLNRWADAADAFLQSFRVDPTFWLASWRYRWATNWAESTHEVDSAARRAYLDHRSELPPSDQLLVEANLLLADSLSAALAAFRQATERFPDNWIAWMEMGDHHLHFASLIGIPQQEARRTLERAVELNPGFVPALQHLIWLYVQERDTTAASRVHTRLVELEAGPGLSELWPGTDYLLQQRLLVRLAAGGGTVPDALLDSVAHDYDRAGVIEPLSPVMFGFNRAQIALHRRALALGGDRLSGGDWLALAVAWAARGAADSGLAILVRLAQRSPGGLDAVPTLATAYLVAAVDVWLGAQDPQVARERRAAAVAAGGTASLDPRSRPRFAWSDGLMALVARDASALDRAIAALERLTDVDGYWLASLRAFRRELAGDRKGAANALAELELARAQSPDQVDLDATVMGVNRLAAARWLLTEGDTLTATRLLRWTNGFARGARVARRYHPYVLYHLATIAEAQGDTSRARRDYEGFLEQYDMPPEAHRGMVEEARAALRRLSQGRD